MRTGLRSGVVLLVFLLSACGSSLIETRLDHLQKLPDGHGVVAVQVVSNTARLDTWLENWTALFVVDLDDPAKRYRMNATDLGLIGSRVFVGAMPPGRYAIFNLHSYTGGGDFQAWLNAWVPRTLGSFHVAPDRLTSLGTIVYQPLGKVAGEPGTDPVMTYVVTRIEDRQDLDDFVAEAYPEFHAGLHDDGILGWIEDDFAASRDGLADRIRSVALAHRAIRLADGTFALAGMLGHIFWRDPDGTWQRSDTGFTNQIGAVAKLGEGYVAGGERGLLIVAPTLEGPWRAVRGPGAQRQVTWLHALQDGSLMVLSRSRHQVRLDRVSSDFGAWRVAVEIDDVRHGLAGHSRPVHAMAATDGRVILFGNRRRIAYDPSSGALDDRSSAEFNLFAQQPDGTLLAVPGNWWSESGAPQFSRDNGEQWTRMSQITFHEYWDARAQHLPVVLSDGREVLSSRKVRRVQPSNRWRPGDTYHTRVAAHAGEAIDAWGEALDENCRSLLPEVSSETHLFALCGDGRVLRSDDLGGTWHLDRDSSLKAGDVPDEMVGRGAEI